MRLWKNVQVFVTILIQMQCLHSARILGVFPIAGKSVNMLYQRLMKELADVGHNVTVINAYKNNFRVLNGSYTDVVLTGFAEDYEVLLSQGDLLNVPETNPIWKSLEFLEMVNPVWNKTFFHPNVQALLKSDQKFDLVITEYFWNDCLKIFAHIYDAPLILFTSMGGVNPWINEQLGNYLPPSYVQHFLNLGDYSNGMGFFSRFHNMLYFKFDIIFKNFYLMKEQNTLLKTAFQNPPDLEDLYNNVALVLLGSHSSLRPATPMSPNTVEIGGFHINPPKKLPKDIQDILDNAKHGVIFFSMGSHVKSSDFSAEKREIILRVFAKLKQTVLWKFEDESLPGKPNNVFIRKWLPQMDLLAHPNIKLFITHGGYGSLQETIYHGVPVLTMPVFADQFNNANQAVQLGYALKLSYNDPNFSEETLYSLIQEMLNNSKYRDNAQHRSRLFHDRPMKPLDTAIYWIEYVIRNKGATHLRLKSVDLPWYQLHMFDVYIFIFICLLLIIKLPCFIRRVCQTRVSIKKLKKN